MSTKRALIALLALAAFVLALPAAASAHRGDRNHDRIPDRWEKRHHLSLRIKQARRDQDHDGLRNLAEYRARMNPRDDDSDDDGVEDGDEQAGRVVSFENGVLTIGVFGGDRIRGLVKPDTEVECEAEDDLMPGRFAGISTRAEGEYEAHESEDDSSSGSGRDDDEQEGGGSGDDDGEETEGCPPGALAPGALVHEAEARVTAAGLVFTEIELAPAR